MQIKATAEAETGIAKSTERSKLRPNSQQEKNGVESGSAMVSGGAKNPTVREVKTSGVHHHHNSSIDECMPYLNAAFPVSQLGSLILSDQKLIDGANNSIPEKTLETETYPAGGKDKSPFKAAVHKGVKKSGKWQREAVSLSVKQFQMSFD